MERVFVYGTLMSGFENSHLLENQKLLGKAFTHYKFTMRARFIPFLSRDSSNKKASNIFGEVYEVDEECLKRLDSLEGHPTFYKREKIYLLMDAGRFEEAWCYLCEDKANHISTTIVESGNYYEYRLNNEKLKRNFTSMRNRDLEITAKNRDLAKKLDDK